MNNHKKAIALISGGLDSVLAARVVMEQGIEVIGICCKHPFHSSPTPGAVAFPELVARKLGIELVRPDVSEQSIALVRDPPHGYGRFMNPCIDCRIMYLRQGERLMNERGASFLITGEVLGQRPMSQRRDTINVIDRDSGLRGQVLRPLSAKLFNPTVAEEQGWIDRERLHAFSGRGRSDQLKLAAKFGVTEYSAPAGGCLLTMEGFAAKMRDLVDHGGRVAVNDVELLKCGRHFRLASATKLVVGKDAHDNRRLMDLAEDGDLLIAPISARGPESLIRGAVEDPQLESACSIIARYIHKVEGPIDFKVVEKGVEGAREFKAAAMDRNALEGYRI